jgi:hypothetical protein
LQVYSSEESGMLIVVNSDIFLEDEKTEGEKIRAPTLRWDLLAGCCPWLGPRPNNKKKQEEVQTPLPNLATVNAESQSCM